MYLASARKASVLPYCFLRTFCQHKINWFDANNNQPKYDSQYSAKVWFTILSQSMIHNTQPKYDSQYSTKVWFTILSQSMIHNTQPKYDSQYSAKVWFTILSQSMIHNTTTKVWFTIPQPKYDSQYHNHNHFNVFWMSSSTNASMFSQYLLCSILKRKTLSESHTE